MMFTFLILIYAVIFNDSVAYPNELERLAVSFVLKDIQKKINQVLISIVSDIRLYYHNITHV